MGTEPSDNQLMNAYAVGDEGAFSVLFGRYSLKLSAFLKFRLGGRKKHLVEDIYQKTWLKVHAGRTTFDPEQKFSTWFYTVALNTLRDEVGSLYEKSPHDEIGETIADCQPSSEEQYISKETFRQIETLFMYLTDSQKTALLLSDQEDLSSKEIAEVMKISDSSARQLVSRARKVIRSHLKHDAEKVSNHE
jgi:RNA polymerase sigma factor (sigma-70 family)